jgi:head-tail adaptor
MLILFVQNEMEARVHSDSANCTEEEVFTEVLRVSRTGHVRGMELGVVPTQPKSSRATSSSQIDVHEDCRKHWEELETSYQSLCEKMAASQERMREEIRAEMRAEVRAEVQAEMRKLLSQFHGLENFSNCIFFIHIFDT